MRKVTCNQVPKVPLIESIETKREIIHERIHVIRRPHQIHSVYNCIQGANPIPNVTLWHPINHLHYDLVNATVKHSFGWIKQGSFC